MLITDFKSSDAKPSSLLMDLRPLAVDACKKEIALVKSRGKSLRHWAQKGSNLAKFIYIFVSVKKEENRALRGESTYGKNDRLKAWLSTFFNTKM